MRIGGMYSGMDTDMMVKQLMQVERAPLDRLFQRKQWTEWQQNAYRDLNLAIATFRDQSAAMRLNTSFVAHKATSTNDGIVSATATANAAAGTYNITNIVLARGASLNSANPISNLENNSAKLRDRVLQEGSGPETFKITNGAGQQATITVTDTDTFETLAQKINSAADADGKSLGLRASFDNTTSRFFISTREMGSDKGFTFEDTQFVQDKILNGAALSGSGASDASFMFNGILVDAQKTNTVRVHGIDINLKQANSSDTITITVTSDTDKIFDQIKSFVDSYNELIEKLDKLSKEPRYRTFPPLTDEQRRELTEREAELWDEKAMSGLLNNDPILRSVINDLRSAFSTPLQGVASGELRMLSEIGITTGNYIHGGKLFIDEDRLRAAIAERPGEVSRLFTKTSDNKNVSEMGIGRRVFEIAESSIKRLREKAGSPGTGFVDSSMIGQSYKHLNSQINRYQDRLIQVENRYWRQFAAMEKALAEMESQSAWMMQNMFGGR